jgi:hypothetical protein
MFLSSSRLKGGCAHALVLAIFMRTDNGWIVKKPLLLLLFLSQVGELNSKSWISRKKTKDIYGSWFGSFLQSSYVRLSLGLRHLPPYQAISLALLISTILDKYKLLSFSFIVLYLIVWIRKKKKKKKQFFFFY